MIAITSTLAPLEGGKDDLHDVLGKKLYIATIWLRGDVNDHRVRDDLVDHHAVVRKGLLAGGPLVGQQRVRVRERRLGSPQGLAQLGVPSQPCSRARRI